MSELVQVVVTTPTEEDARRIAAALVEGRLAACVQVAGPLQRTYRWKGAVETATEWQCVAKTRLELFARVEEAITRLHPYQVPEILAIPVAAAAAPYARWLVEETG